MDDEPVVREVLATQLRDEGLDVAEAGDGAEALALLDRGEAVDLLVSDLAMPGLDGVELTREAQRRRSGLPAILLTGYAGDAAALAVGNAVNGAFTVLRKPITGTELADRATMLLRSQGQRLEMAG